MVRRYLLTKNLYVVHSLDHLGSRLNVGKLDLDLLLLEHDVAVFYLVRRDYLTDRVDELAGKIP